MDFIKYIFIFLLTGIITLILTNITLAENYVKFEDSFNCYGLEYPSNWKARKTPNSKNLIKLSLDKDHVSGLQIRIHKTNKDFKSFVKWYIDDYRKQMSGRNKGKVYIIQEKSFNSEKLKGTSISCRYSVRPYKWFVKHYMWPSDNKVYVMQCGTSIKERHSFEPVIDKVAQSFRLL